MAESRIERGHSSFAVGVVLYGAELRPELLLRENVPEMTTFDSVGFAKASYFQLFDEIHSCHILWVVDLTVSYGAK